MSWIGEHVTQLETWAKDLIGHADARIHAIGEDLARVAGELRGDAPKLATEVEQDAADIAKTAATEGVIPAEHEAIADGTTLIVDAGHDVAAAVEGSNKPAAAEPSTPPTSA